MIAEAYSSPPAQLPRAPASTDTAFSTMSRTHPAWRN